MAVIGQGTQDDVGSLDVQPGQSYRYTLTLPIELSTDQATFVVGMVKSILGLLVTLGAVYTRPAGAGWTDLVIEFGT